MQKAADYWIEQGIEQGRVQNLQDNILYLIHIRFAVTNEEIAEKIKAVVDITILQELLREAATAVTMEAFTERLTELTEND